MIIMHMQSKHFQWGNCITWRMCGVYEHPPFILWNSCRCHCYKRAQWYKAMAKAIYTTYSGIIRRNNWRRVLEKASRGLNPKYACTSSLLSITWSLATRWMWSPRQASSKPTPESLPMDTWAMVSLTGMGGGNHSNDNPPVQRLLPILPS